MGKERVSTVARTFDILDALSEVKCATPTEVAKLLDLPVSSVHDYLSTLESLGYAVKDDGCYSVSASLFKFPGKMRVQNDLYNASKRVVEQLAEDTGDQAAVGQREGRKIIFLYIQNANEQFDIKNYPGMSLPLHASASGKLILASLSEAELNSFLDEQPPSFTSRTQTNATSLREELEQVEEQGYACNRGEYESGMQTVAVPISYRDELVGTLCLTSPTNRMEDPDFKNDIIDKLLQASNVIEINLRDHPSLTESM